MYKTRYSVHVYRKKYPRDCQFRAQSPTHLTRKRASGTYGAFSWHYRKYVNGC